MQIKEHTLKFDKKFTKILLISDTHRHTTGVIKLLNKAKFDLVVHLGDMIQDALDLSSIYTETLFFSVRGNCDFYEYEGTDILTLNVNNSKLIFCHGHQFYVKNSTEQVEAYLKKQNGDAIFFGHSHQRFLQEKMVEQKKILIMNPSSAALPRDGKAPSFGLLEVERKGILHASFGEIKKLGKKC